MTNEREQIDGATAGERAIGLWNVFVRHIVLIVFMAGVGGSLGYLYFLKTPPTYQSTASALIRNDSKEQNIPFQGTESSQPTQREQPHSLIVMSPQIVRRALEMELGDDSEDGAPKRRLKDLPYFFGMENPTGHIISRLSARPGIQNNNMENHSILNMSYRDVDGLTTKAVLDAVLESYKEFLGESHKSGSGDVLRLIEHARDSLLKQLDELETVYNQFRQDTPLLFNSEAKATNVHKERLTVIESERGRLIALRAERKADLDSVTDAVQRGHDKEAIAMMLAQQKRDNRDVGVKSLQEEVFPLLVEHQMLLQNLGAEHPKVKSMAKKIELTRELWLQEEGGDPSPKKLRKSDFVTVCLEAMRHELRSIDARLDTLDELYEDEKHESRSVNAYEAKNEKLLKDIARTEELYQGVVKRLEELNLLQDYGGFKTSVISPPVVGRRVAPDFFQSLGIGGLCGALVGFALGYLLEKNDKRFHSPQEISAFLNLPIVGHIPVIQRDGVRATGSSKLDRSLVAFFKPKSRLSEAYRGIRTSLYFSTRGEQHKVIQITSPNPGDGKTTLSSNLAISIAQSGKRVLLIDADFRRPRVHKLFGLNMAVGMCSVLEGNAELPDAVQATEVDNLWILPCGPRPGNPSELLTSRRFEELLDVLREQYDFVLVDTPPVLVVTDPSAVAARVDGVMLTFRLTKQTRYESARAVEQISSIGGNLLGIIVNGLGKKSGYGGYGGSYGGYGGGYGSGYTQYGGYGNYQSADKYLDADQEQPRRNPDAVGETPARGRRSSIRRQEM